MVTVKKNSDRIIVENVIQFLALDHQDKHSYLPPTSEDIEYVLGNTGDKTSYPLLYFAFVGNIYISLWIPNVDGEQRQVLREIHDLLEIMIDCQDYLFYAWITKAAKSAISSPVDTLWDILRRLSLLFLEGIGWEIRPPQLTFDEIFS